MGRSMIVLVTSLALSACAPAAPAQPSHRSGTRLRARLQILEDGTTRFVGWRDTELGVDCFFARDSEGTYRCLPRASLAPAYADPACAVLAHASLLCGGEELPRWVLRRGGASSGECGIEDPSNSEA